MLKRNLIIAGLLISGSSVAYADGNLDSQTTSYAKGGFSIGIDGGWGNLAGPEQMYPTSYYGDGIILEPFQAIPAHIKYTNDTDVGDWVYGAHIGYDFVVNSKTLLGFELGYKNLGKTSNLLTLDLEDMRYPLHVLDADAYKDTNQYAIDFLLTGHYFIWQGLNIFGKAGVALVNTDTDQQISVLRWSETGEFTHDVELPATSGSEFRLQPEGSIGIGYMFLCGADIHVSYDYIMGSNGNNGLTDILSQNKPYTSSSVLAGVSYTF